MSDTAAPSPEDRLLEVTATMVAEMDARWRIAREESSIALKTMNVALRRYDVGIGTVDSAKAACQKWADSHAEVQATADRYAQAAVLHLDHVEAARRKAKEQQP